MSRRRNEWDEPRFKGIDDNGEPVFVWNPETPEWIRRAHVAEWKRVRAPRKPAGRANG